MLLFPSRVFTPAEDLNSGELLRLLSALDGAAETPMQLPRRSFQQRIALLRLNISSGEHVLAQRSTEISTCDTLHRATFLCCSARSSKHFASLGCDPWSIVPSVLQATLPLQILEAHRELELFVGLDVDPLAVDKARARIEALVRDGFREELKAYTYVENFKQIKTILGGADENLLSEGVDGIFMDLGISSMQVDCSERGFSILGNGPLDMRMDPQATLKAADILNFWPEAEVGRILLDYGEESNWWVLQEKIMNARKTGGLHSTRELVDLVRKASGKSGGRHGWIKTATRVFQALRIAVNDELHTLENALYACFDCLSAGGRLAVISFHSLEDRIVKKAFLDIIERGEEDKESYTNKKVDEIGTESQLWVKQRVVGKNGTILTKRPISPSKDEERLNCRCRSAKLRVLQKH